MIIGPVACSSGSGRGGFLTPRLDSSWSKKHVERSRETEESKKHSLRVADLSLLLVASADICAEGVGCFGGGLSRVFFLRLAADEISSRDL